MGAVCINVTDASNVFNPPTIVCLFPNDHDLISFRLAKDALENGRSLSEVIFAPCLSPIYNVGSFSKHKIIVSADGSVLLHSEIPESGEYVETVIGDVLSGGGLLSD